MINHDLFDALELKSQKNIKDVLLDGGELISVDYGDNAYLSSKYLRACYDLKQNCNIYDKPGYKDITNDVNFTDFIKRAADLGMQFHSFGKQE